MKNPKAPILQFLPESTTLDQVQQKVLNIMGSYITQLESETFFSFLKKRPVKKGIYLYGGVGRGKTMLIQAFFKALKLKKQFIHYQNFMQRTHQELHYFREKGNDNIVGKLASLYAQSAKVLLLDEFEIKDITDAMIIGQLFHELIKKDVFILITSNTVPDNLYKGGLQRESFLPFISMIKKDFEILELDNNKDYRKSKSSSFNSRILHPLNEQTQEQMNNIIQQVTDNSTGNENYIEVFGRKILFAKTYKNILITSYEELFLRELGYADYVNICQKFNIIVLENIPKIPEDHTDIAIRFINFIDNAYFYKVLLFISLESPPEEIYKAGKRVEEFKRTISRLHEMNSSSYPEGQNGK